MKRPISLVVLGVAIVSAILAQPYRLVMIHGPSMSPTFESGNLVLSSRVVPSLRHGDVVVFQHDGETLVKRIAFVPGDRILEFKFRGQWIAPGNDFLLAVAANRHYAQRATTIPAGKIYVLGDNSDESVDSRTFGPVPTSSIIGRVLDEPKPQLIVGFAGATVLDEKTAKLVTRKAPLPEIIGRGTKNYYARLESAAYQRATRVR